MYAAVHTNQLKELRYVCCLYVIVQTSIHKCAGQPTTDISQLLTVDKTKNILEIFFLGGVFFLYTFSFYL